MKLFFASLFMMLSVTVASACPDYTRWGSEINITGEQLYSPRQFSVVAGGDQNLENCKIDAANWGGSLTGHVISEPDYSISISGVSGYDLEFRVIGTCDTVLLINNAHGTWFYDDDSYGDGDPKIRLNNPGSDGVYDVWIGTFNGAACDATLIVESF